MEAIGAALNQEPLLPPGLLPVVTAVLHARDFHLELVTIGPDDEHGGLVTWGPLPFAGAN